MIVQIRRQVQCLNQTSSPMSRFAPPHGHDSSTTAADAISEAMQEEERLLAPRQVSLGRAQLLQVSTALQRLAENGLGLPIRVCLQLQLQHHIIIIISFSCCFSFVAAASSSDGSSALGGGSSSSSGKSSTDLRNSLSKSSKRLFSFEPTNPSILA
jgi:hypothetical protein